MNVMTYDPNLVPVTYTQEVLRQVLDNIKQ